MFNPFRKSGEVVQEEKDPFAQPKFEVKKSIKLEIRLKNHRISRDGDEITLFQQRDSSYGEKPWASFKVDEADTIAAAILAAVDA